jgi:hypothetical protein
MAPPEIIAGRRASEECPGSPLSIPGKLVGENSLGVCGFQGAPAPYGEGGRRAESKSQSNDAPPRGGWVSVAASERSLGKKRSCSAARGSLRGFVAGQSWPRRNGSDGGHVWRDLDSQGVRRQPELKTLGCLRILLGCLRILVFPSGRWSGSLQSMGSRGERLPFTWTLQANINCPVSVEESAKQMRDGGMDEISGNSRSQSAGHPVR